MTVPATVRGRSIVLSSLRKLFLANSVRLSGSDMSKADASQVYGEYVDAIKSFVPALKSDLYKGQCGRIGVIGGSFEYTGAPYFAAISALKLGADLVYVFCCKDAGPVIKSYSPELIVLPILDDAHVVRRISSWLSRLHCLIIGPGLGRDPGLLKNVSHILSYCSEDLNMPLPLVIDADGVFLISQDTYLVESYKGPVILTPNAVEYKRLSSSFQVSEPLHLAQSLRVVLLQKGAKDVITNGMSATALDNDKSTIVCHAEGSNRRCGGQGDILSGCLGTLAAWCHMSLQKKWNLSGSSPKEEMMELFRKNCFAYSLAAYGACIVTKNCNKLAYAELGRSMTASDMIPHIHNSFMSIFGE